MVGIEYSTDNYKYLKVSVRAIIENPEMITYIPDHLKTKKMLNDV